jgi:hydrogenase expression/formation protein HypC
MCLGLAGRVVARDAGSDLADVEIGGSVRPINMALLEAPVRPGDWVLIHSGFALEPMTAEEARDAMALLGGPGAEGLIDG